MNLNPFVMLFQAELRKMQNQAAELRKDAQIKKAIASRKERYLLCSSCFSISIEAEKYIPLIRNPIGTAC